MVVSLWILRSTAQPPGSPANRIRWPRAVRLAGHLGLAVSAAALLANTFGYVFFANVLGGTLLESGYLALIFYASVEVLDGLVMIALEPAPAECPEHRRLSPRLVASIAPGVCCRCSPGLCGFSSRLQRLLLREPLFDIARQFLNAQLAVGSVSASQAIYWLSD